MFNLYWKLKNQFSRFILAVLRCLGAGVTLQREKAAVFSVGLKALSSAPEVCAPLSACVWLCLCFIKGESRVGWRNTGRSGMPALLQSVSILRADCRGSTLAKEQKPISGKILSHSWLRRCTS